MARSQVRLFHDDDEAAHENVTEHMRDLGKRQLHESPVKTSLDKMNLQWTAQGENTATRPPGPDGEGQMNR